MGRSIPIGTAQGMHRSLGTGVFKEILRGGVGGGNGGSSAHLTMTSKDGVSKERIDYEKPFSNCSKELALRNRI